MWDKEKLPEGTLVRFTNERWAKSYKVGIVEVEENRTFSYEDFVPVRILEFTDVEKQENPDVEKLGVHTGFYPQNLAPIDKPVEEITKEIIEI